MKLLSTRRKYSFKKGMRNANRIVKKVAKSTIISVIKKNDIVLNSATGEHKPSNNKQTKAPSAITMLLFDFMNVMI